MFLRMLKQSFLEKRRSKLLAIATVCLSAGLITALMNLSLDVGNKMAQELKSYGANIHILPKSESVSLEIDGKNYNPLKDQVFLEERYLAEIKDIFWRNNIIGFAPFLKTMVQIIDDKQSRIPLIGTYFDKHLAVLDENDFHTGVKEIYRHWQVEGEWPGDENSSECLVGRVLVNQFGWRIGESIQIRTLGEKQKRIILVIKGILQTGEQEENSIIAPLGVVQKLTGFQGKVQSVSISAVTAPENYLCRKARRDIDELTSEEYDQWYCSAYASSIAYQIEEVIPNASAKLIWKIAAGEGAIIGKIQLLMLVVTIAAFTASVLGISSLMSSSIMERSKEIGLIKALGADNWNVYLLFIAEAAILGIIGGMLGVIAGYGISQVMGMNIFQATVSFNPITVPVIIMVSVLIVITGSLIPSRLITKLHPAKVLHGN